MKHMRIPVFHRETFNVCPLTSASTLALITVWFTNKEIAVYIKRTEISGCKDRINGHVRWRQVLNVYW